MIDIVAVRSRIFGIAFSSGLSVARVLRDIVMVFKWHVQRSYSQHGEDCLVLSLFGSDYVGTYVDIGASHPIRISNTYLLYKKGWRGIAVEPIPIFRLYWRIFRPKDRFLNVALGCRSGIATFYEMYPSVLSTLCDERAHDLIAKGHARLITKRLVKVITPQQLIEEHLRFAPTDVLSLDTEGLDESLLQSFPFTMWRPKVIVVEATNESSRNKIAEMLGRVSYKRCAECGCNEIWVDENWAARRTSCLAAEGGSQGAVRWASRDTAKA